MTKDFFFCVCDCSSIEWIENVKIDGKIIERINWLTSEGLQKYPRKIDIKFQQKWFSYDQDLICNDCENRLQPIPFSDINKEIRKSLFKMSNEDKIRFVHNYKIVKTLEKDNG